MDSLIVECTTNEAGNRVVEMSPDFVEFLEMLAAERGCKLVFHDYEAEEDRGETTD